MEDFAESVPVFVRRSGDAYELVSTVDVASLSTHEKLREALDATLEHVAVKEPNLRDEDGEPNGVWRWFPAASEEATANELDGMRMTRANLWQMAAGLNAASQPVPIDGGPQPDGMRPSDVHGTAADSATPANGWAHAGVVYVDANDRGVLFLRGEVLPEIAPELDRGRIAYGSVHFNHSPVNEDGVADRVSLESFALTNRPVDTQLQAASGVRAARTSNEQPRVSIRARRLNMSENVKTRGAAVEAFAKIATLLGVDPAEDLNDESWYSQVVEKARLLHEQARTEQVVESVAGGEAQLAEANEETGESSETTETTESRSRAVEGLEGAELEAFTADVIALLREVIGNPDATPAEILAELDARRESLAAALGVAVETTTPEGGTPPQETTMSQENKDEAARSRARMQTDLIAQRARATKAEKERDAANAKLRAIEDERWLDAELKKRGITLNDEDRKVMLSTTAKHGRDLVLVSLRAIGRPPAGEVVTTQRAQDTKRVQVSRREAVAAAEKEVLEEAKLRGQTLSATKAHRLAMTRARAKNPDLFEVPETATR